MNDIVGYSDPDAKMNIMLSYLYGELHGTDKGVFEEELKIDDFLNETFQGALKFKKEMGFTHKAEHIQWLKGSRSRFSKMTELSHHPENSVKKQRPKVFYYLAATACFVFIAILVTQQMIRVDYKEISYQHIMPLGAICDNSRGSDTPNKPIGSNPFCKNDFKGAIEALASKNQLSEFESVILATSLMKEKEFNKAINVWQNASLESSAYNDLIKFNLSLSYLGSGQFQKAYASLIEIQNDPTTTTLMKQKATRISEKIEGFVKN